LDPFAVATPTVFGRSNSLVLLLLLDGGLIRRADQAPVLACAEWTGRQGILGEGSFSREQLLLCELSSYIERGEQVVSKDVVSSNLDKSTPPLRIELMRLTNCMVLGQCPV
jgi:hypothetical protein